MNDIQAPTLSPIRPCLKWAGGKARVLPKIREALYGVPGERLVEPFVGSGVVFLNLQRFSRLLIADTNKDLVALFQIIANNPEALIVKTQLLFQPSNNTQEAYLHIRSKFNSDTPGSIERAARFIYLNRHGFNGLCRYNSKGIFNVPFGSYINPILPKNEIYSIHDRMQNLKELKIINADFRLVFSDMLRKGDVVYADPPYAPLSVTASFTSYSSNSFGATEQKALAEASQLASSNGISVLVSNHDLQWIREIYFGAEITSFPVKRTISCNSKNRKPAQEILALWRAKTD